MGVWRPENCHFAKTARLVNSGILALQNGKNVIFNGAEPRFRGASPLVLRGGGGSARSLAIAKPLKTGYRSWAAKAVGLAVAGVFRGALPPVAGMF